MSPRSPVSRRRHGPAGGPVGPVRLRGQYHLPDEIARRVWAGHPWVFRDALRDRPVVEPTGTLVDLVSGNRDFLARGFVDQEHAIVVRVLCRQRDERVAPGAGAIAARLRRAVELRPALVGSDGPTALRLFTGESEGLPGVTVDRYGDFVLVQWLSGGALPWRDELLSALEATVRPRGIYEQRRLRPPAGGQAEHRAATRAAGEEAPVEVLIEEAGCRFAVDVTAPAGVGFFPDLRLGRDAVAKRAAGRRVVNLFAYTGAFSVRAAKAGAASVVAVDTAAKAHARARRNYELSGLDPTTMEQVTGDAGKTLERFAARGRRFDLVICDPPTFSRGPRPGDTFAVASDLADLAAAAFAVLDPGGLLAFSSNSGKLSMGDLDRAVAQGAAARGAEARIVERLGLPPDYPINPGFPEGNYLKFLLAIRV